MDSLNSHTPWFITHITSLSQTPLCGIEIESSVKLPRQLINDNSSIATK